MTARFEQIAGTGVQRQRRLQMLAEAGEYWRRLGQIQRARHVFECLVELAPQEAAGHLGLAETLLRSEELEAALAAAERAAAAPRGDSATMAYASVVCAIVLTRLDRLEAAQRWCRRAVTLDAEGPAGNLARTWQAAVAQLQRQAIELASSGVRQER